MPQITSMGSRRHFVEFQDRVEYALLKCLRGPLNAAASILSASRQPPSSIRSRGMTSGRRNFRPEVCPQALLADESPETRLADWPHSPSVLRPPRHSDARLVQPHR